MRTLKGAVKQIAAFGISRNVRFFGDEFKIYEAFYLLYNEIDSNRQQLAEDLH